MKLTHASVFSGIGGPEVAASMLGWENLFHCEINPFGRAVLEYWFPNAKSYEDITKTDFSEWGGKVNILTGGFPCQPFSYAGQRRGADDDRYLWPFMHRCINQVRPDWVVCENVAGILTMVEQGDVTEMAAEKSLFDEVDTLHRYRLEETFTLERICQDLECDGYAVQAVIIPACAVNAPHRRDRVFIIGHRIVADTDNGANGRTARKNEGESSAQRLQERHEVRQPDQPTQVRPTAEGYVPDPIRTGLEGQDQPRCGQGGQRVHLRRDPARCDRQDDQERTTATDTDCRGEAAHRKGDGTESGWSDSNQLTGERRAETQRDSGLSSVLRPAADTSDTGLQEARPEQQAAGDRGFGLRNGSDAPNPDCNRRCEMDEHLQPRLTDGSKPVGNGRERIVADTENKPCKSYKFGEQCVGNEKTREFRRGISGADPKQPFAHTSQQCGQRNGFEQPGTGRAQQEQSGGRSRQERGVAGCGRWDTFPTVSPVHRGNDGIPFPLDDLTISPSKWRTESLKAYGNAIVPQVMYEIFRAIEETYK